MASPTATDVYGTSAWQVGHANNTARFADVLRRYGLVPDAATLSQYGLSGLFDPNTSANAAANPNSILAALGRARDTGFHSNLHAASAHNALGSGAALNAADQVGRDYQSNVGQAGSDELSALLGLGGDESTLYQTIFGDLLNRPQPDPNLSLPTPPPQQISVPQGVASGAGTGIPTPQTPYVRTGPEAGWTPPKPPKPGVFGGRGHIT